MKKRDIAGKIIKLVAQPDVRWPLVSQCSGCSHIRSDHLSCDVYRFPGAMWSAGNCVMATHLIKEARIEKLVDPIKAGKAQMKNWAKKK